MVIIVMVIIVMVIVVIVIEFDVRDSCTFRHLHFIGELTEETSKTKNLQLEGV